jgi:hypothetical protein
MKTFPPILALLTVALSAFAEESVAPVFNRSPLIEKPYSELPLGAIEPQGWLRKQLEIMASGMTGHLDELYPEVVGPRNGWLGGDGDGWERGPYWIDGALPLAHLIDDEELLRKVNRWVEWTLANQRADGYIGPQPFPTAPKPEPGLQRGRRRDWWPKMVMLKVLQQHYMATGDQRVIDCLSRYFRFQADQLPRTPLNHWAYWGNRRGADNLMVVYWLYNITGEPFLLELGNLIHEQTHPYTDIFLEREKVKRFRFSGASDDAFHCVNLAQGMKAPIIRYQADSDSRHLRAVQYALGDIEEAHGQPHGLYGGDEGMHGTVLTQGSELCAAIEMMFSLEKMLEITGALDFADRLEMVAFNVLPTQVSDDYLTRQYYQQANQVACTIGKRNFIQESKGERIVYGLLNGYPCCTCNLHQGWPKFTQHLWMASSDGGLAALTYAPCRVVAEVGEGHTVGITESTAYPFEDAVRFRVETEYEVTFPLHLRVPAWCETASFAVNGEEVEPTRQGNLVVLNRSWKSGDEVLLSLPARLRTKRWRENSVSLYRGPLLYVLEIQEAWSETVNGLREVRPTSHWNYALIEEHVNDPERFFHVRSVDEAVTYPWDLPGAPIRLEGKGIRHPQWGLYNDSAGPVPWSPQRSPANAEMETITLVPYGSSTLRISAFPTFRKPNN